MGNRKLKKHLQQILQQKETPEKELNEIKRKETIQFCIEIMREQKSEQRYPAEPRNDFIRYLSDVFRFEGVPIFGLQAAALLIICLMIRTAAGSLSSIAVWMPLFTLAVMPVMFRCKYYRMSEIEAATRASGPQIMLAKLILAGAADLLCMTIFILFEVRLKKTYEDTGQIILYCLVPYLVCMVSMLRLIRSCRKENIQICAAIVLTSCLGWGMLAKVVPWLYDRAEGLPESVSQGK